MKKITTETGIFGPYVNIETQETGYLCDNILLPFIVIGTGEISDWEGELPVIVQPRPITPVSVTMRQAVLALLDTELLDDIEVIVASLPRRYQLEWERASEVLRDNPLVEMVRLQKDMTTEQIDDLFIAASKL